MSALAGAAPALADGPARTFRAMGTDIELRIGPGAEDDAQARLAAAESEFHRLESLLSRFQPESELSRLNRAGRIVAGPELFEVVRLALEARELTRGRFDPTIHDALVAAGYDRSFELVAADGPGPAGEPAPCGGRVVLDPGRRSIMLDPGVRLDLGGIGKGYAVDRVSALLAGDGSTLVNAGGDLAVRGAWPVGVPTAAGSMTLLLEDGALATTGRDRRRWRRGGEERHHLIDPASARPADTDLLRVTVVAATAVEAETRAKALFLAGSGAGGAEADELGIPALLVTADGRTLLHGGLR